MSVQFPQHADIDVLLADAVVGKCKYREALLVLRACCHSLRAAVDCSIDGWCSRFSKSKEAAFATIKIRTSFTRRL